MPWGYQILADQALAADVAAIDKELMKMLVVSLELETFSASGYISIHWTKSTFLVLAIILFVLNMYSY